MKKLLMLAALTLAGFTYAQAQPVYGTVTLLSASGLTNTTVGAATWSTQVIDTRKADYVALQFTGAASVTEANVVTITYALSVDGVTYENPATVRTAVITASATGGTARTIVTNIPTAGVGYLKIISLSNAASAGGQTNVTIKASQKLLNGR